LYLILELSAEMLLKNFDDEKEKYIFVYGIKCLQLFYITLYGLFILDSSQIYNKDKLTGIRKAWGEVEFIKVLSFMARPDYPIGLLIKF